MVLLKRDLSSALVGARARGGTPGVNKRQVASPFLAGDLHLHPHHSLRKRTTQVLAVSTSTYTQVRRAFSHFFLSYEFSLSQRSNPTTKTCDVFVKRSSVWEYSWAERFQCRVCV